MLTCPLPGRLRRPNPPFASSEAATCAWFVTRNRPEVGLRQMEMFEGSEEFEEGEEERIGEAEQDDD
jgi:hypothetical protein